MDAPPVSGAIRTVRCPSCGGDRLRLRSKPDRIDRVYQTPSGRVKRLFARDMQLYHCYVCRLQFYDVVPAVVPAVQPALVETPAAVRGAETTLIGETVMIKGRLSSREDILLSGEIEGDVEMPGQRLAIAATGRVRGDVVAAEVEVIGIIEGTVHFSPAKTAQISSANSEQTDSQTQKRP